MDGKITSIDKAVSERMKLFMSHYGYTQCDRPYIAYGTKRIDDAVRKIIDYVNSDKA